MLWSETIASQCRYGDIAGKIWSDWEILWEDSESDYQGHASFLAQHESKYCFYEWWYGSCPGCDGWESDEKSDEDIKEEMQKTAMWFKNKKELMRWLNMLEGRTPINNYSMERGGGLATGLDMLGGDLLNRINAIRKHFGMEEYKPKEDKNG
jgi:hypothetical protein